MFPLLRLGLDTKHLYRFLYTGSVLASQLVSTLGNVRGLAVLQCMPARSNGSFMQPGGLEELATKCICEKSEVHTVSFVICHK